MNLNAACIIPTLTRRDAAYLIALIVTASLFHFSIVFQGQIPLDEDSLLFFYPLRALHSDPNVGFWNPYLFCGYPRDANPQAQILYFPNLLFLFVSAGYGYCLLVIGHIVLGAALMALLLRGLRLSEEAAWFGAFAFLLSTFWRCKITNLGLLEGISWIPGVLYFYLVTLESNRWTSRAACGLLLSMTILAGVPHTVIYTLVILGLITLCYILFRHRTFISALVIFFSTLAIASTLTVGMWLPAWLYLPESGRQALELSKALEGSIDWMDIWKVFLGGLSQPEISRCDPWEGTCYFGATALFFIPAGFRSLPRRFRTGLALILLFAILCTLGGDGWLFPFLYRWIPGWNTLNLPNRSLLMAAISIPVLSAFGFQSWLNRTALPKMRIVLLIAFSFLLLAMAAVAGYFHPSVWRALGHSALTSTFHPESISDGQWALLSFAVWTALTTIVTVSLASSKYQSLRVISLLALLGAQSALYSPRLFLQTTTSDFYILPRAVRLAEKNQTAIGSRMCSFVPAIDSGSDVRMSLIQPAMIHRLPEVFRIHEIQGYDPLFPKRYAQLIRAWAGHSRATDLTRTIRLETLPKRLLDFLSVSTIVGYPNQEILYMGKPEELYKPGLLESRLKTPQTVQSVQVRWLLAGGSEIPQEALVARVNVLNGSETIQTFPVRAGIEIANYILDYSNAPARHQAARVYRWFPIPSPDGYTAIRQYMASFDLQAPSLIDRVSLEYLSPVGRLAVMEISVLTTNERGLEKIGSSAELPVYNNPGAFPSIYMTRRIHRYQNLEEIVEAFDTHKSGEEIPVFFPEEEEIPFESSPISIPLSESEITQIQRPDSDRISLHIRSKFDGLLVLTENYSPNWTAKVNEESVPVFQANHAFMAIPVPAGDHQIAFHYLPRPYYYAISIGGSMLTFVILLLVLYPRRWLLPPRNKEEWIGL